jgi:uncharacterized MAPEG superfamily protein
MDIAETYQITIVALGALAALMFIQILILDVVGIRAKHRPGYPIPADHGSFHFRASRVVQNSNESIAVFLLATLFCVLSDGDVFYVACGAWMYVVSRFLYAVFYYLNIQLARSVVFGVSLVAIATLIIAGFIRL